MEKINNWNEIEAKGMEDFKSLPIGAYECVIKEANVHKSEQSGKESFRVAVDIAKGEYKDYYQKRYDNNTNENKKWDNNACKYFGLGETGLPFLKGFITCVENSNNGYKWDWDESKLKGKTIACIFRYEEYEKQDGTKGVKTRLSQFRSIDKLEELKDERYDSIKLLNGTYMDIDDYYENRQEHSTNPFEGMEDVVEITDDILD